MRYPFLYPLGTIDYVTVDDMYKFAQANNAPLLSSFNADFWEDYISNHTVYDKAFRRMYKSFHYFDQKPKINGIEDTDIEEVTNDFTDEVYAHLVMNRKRYSELYRIWTVSDSEYSITHGYLYNETHTESGTSEGTRVEGERIDATEKVKGTETDTRTDQYGAHSNTKTDAKGQYTITGSSNEGAQTTTSSNAKGARTDTENIEKDAYSDSEVTSTAAHISTEQTQNGGYTDTTENQKAAFNTAVYSPYEKTTFTHSPETETVSTSFGPEEVTKDFTGGVRAESKTTVTGAATDQITENKGARADTSEETHGAHTDMLTESLGAYTNTSENVEGARSDTEDFTKGEQTNTSNDEYEKRLLIQRYGNLGDQSVTDILEKHEKYWSKFNFYKLIFTDICKELLLVE